MSSHIRNLKFKDDVLVLILCTRKTGSLEAGRAAQNLLWQILSRSPYIWAGQGWNSYGNLALSLAVEEKRSK
jgi:hypothetical protein